MNNKSATSEAKKLTLMFRVEPGCLGPEGITQIEDFCQFAQNKLTKYHADFLIIEILPRFDKSISEIIYMINNKTLSRDQATTYLDLFNMETESMEETLQEEIAELIEEFTTQ